MRLIASLSVFAVALGAIGCSGYSHTVRLVDGKPIDERPITPAAYAAYTSAARFEVLGQLELARAAYQEALSHDPDSVDIQTRIATLTCQLDPDQATPEFEAAEELDSDYEGLWREWALCELRRGKLTRALRMANRSVASAPDSLRASVTVAQVHEARAEPSKAIRQLVAFVIRFPENIEGWRRLYEAARRQQDPVWSYAASQHLSARLARGQLPPALGEAPEKAVRRVLLDTDLSQARHAAIEQRVSVTRLGWIALHERRPLDALAQAKLSHHANPKDLEAAILGLAATHDAGKSAAFRIWLRAVPEGTVDDLSETAREALVRLIRERLGEQDASVLERALEVVPTHASPPDITE
jgi:tetratricopeptide (TPR) repeat protein